MRKNKSIEEKMLEKQRKIAESVSSSNKKLFGFKSSRESWDYSRMRQNDFVGRDALKLKVN